MKNYLKLLCMILVFACLLISCDQEDSGKEESTTENGTASLVCEHTYENGQCSQCGKWIPYDLVYVSNGYGTCYVSDIVTYPYYGEKFVLEIPALSPDGDKVTAVRYQGFSHTIPLMLLVEDYDRIEAAMTEKIKEGELNDFLVKKFCVYFSKKSLNEALSVNAKLALLEQYPITEFTDIYIYDQQLAKEWENKRNVSFLYEYGDFTFADLLATHDKLLKVVQESGAQNKEELLKTIPQLRRDCGSNIQSVVLPKGIEEVSTELFSTLVNLETLVLPDCMTQIPEAMFRFCWCLSSITIPKTVTEIGQGAFSGCSNLTAIHFEGTIAEWESVIKMQNWGQGVKDCIVYCTDGEIVESGK